MPASALAAMAVALTASLPDRCISADRRPGRHILDAALSLCADCLMADVSSALMDLASEVLGWIGWRERSDPARTGIRNCFALPAAWTKSSVASEQDRPEFRQARKRRSVAMFAKSFRAALIAATALLSIAGVTGAQAGITSNGPSPNGVIVDASTNLDSIPLDGVTLPATEQTEITPPAVQPMVVAGTINGPSLSGLVEDAAGVNLHSTAVAPAAAAGNDE
jgi:hypothetical protein